MLSAFIKNRVSEVALKGSTGYGYGDVGRDVIDRVFADAFGAEDALVRHNFVSGTHALSVALFGVLRTGDTLLSVTGKPYVITSYSIHYTKLYEKQLQDILRWK